MKTTPIDWHPYPKETPPEEGDYFVTVHNSISGATFTDDASFSLEIDAWKGWGIIAWAYPIEPYRRKE